MSRTYVLGHAAAIQIVVTQADLLLEIEVADGDLKDSGSELG